MLGLGDGGGGEVRALAIGLVLLAGCPDAALRAQTAAANTMGAAAVMAAKTARTIATAQLDECDRLPSMDETRACALSVEADWEPVWAALTVYAEAHDAWASAIESGGVPEFGAVTGAFCALVVALDGAGVEVPDGGIC